MDFNLGKCGCNCNECPTYKSNLKTISDRKKCSAGWGKFIGIKLSPEKLRLCDGCSIPDSQRKTYYLNCKIRKCAMINGVENCAYCIAFPCAELQGVHSLQKIKSLEEYSDKTGKEISREDYTSFIEPYAGLSRLQKIRDNLNRKQYREFKNFSVKTRFVPFPLKQESLKSVYSLLTSVYIEQDISYARLLTLEGKRIQLLKILWTILLYGNLTKENYIEINAKNFLSGKTGAMYNMLIDNFNELKKYGVFCEIVPIIKEGWLTPLGGLKKEGWIIKLTFGKTPDQIKSIHAFKEYVLRLEKKYGRQAFRYFNAADFRVMMN